jgi:hypothetical protein
VRIYYDSNFFNTEPRAYFESYLDAARKSFKDVQSEDVKVSGLAAYRVSYAGAPRQRRNYLPPPPGDKDGAGRFEGETPKAKEGQPEKEKDKGEEQPPPPGAAAPDTKSAGKPREERTVVEYRLIQTDGVVTLYCSATPADLPRLAEIFDQVGGYFTLTFTRRW